MRSTDWFNSTVFHGLNNSSYQLSFQRERAFSPSLWVAIDGLIYFFVVVVLSRRVIVFLTKSMKMLSDTQAHRGWVIDYSWLIWHANSECLSNALGMPHHSSLPPPSPSGGPTPPPSPSGGLTRSHLFLLDPNRSYFLCSYKLSLEI